VVLLMPPSCPLITRATTPAVADFDTDANHDANYGILSEGGFFEDVFFDALTDHNALTNRDPETNAGGGMRLSLDRDVEDSVRRPLIIRKLTATDGISKDSPGKNPPAFSAEGGEGFGRGGERGGEGGGSHSPSVSLPESDDLAGVAAALEDAANTFAEVRGFCFALRCVTLRCVALSCVALRCVALCSVALPCVVLRCLALRCVALRCVALCCVMLLCVALCCIALLELPCLALPCLA
jgi:hypothetical protein